jgi:hypothetical protein
MNITFGGRTLNSRNNEILNVTESPIEMKGGSVALSMDTINPLTSGAGIIASNSGSSSIGLLIGLVFKIFSFIMSIIPTLIFIFNTVVIVFFLYVLNKFLGIVHKILKQIYKTPILGPVIKKQKIPKNLWQLIISYFNLF